MLTGDGVTDGVAAVDGADVSVKLDALAALIGSDDSVAAFVDGTSTYIFQNLDGSADVSDADSFIELAGVQLASIDGLII